MDLQPKNIKKRNFRIGEGWWGWIKDMTLPKSTPVFTPKQLAVMMADGMMADCPTSRHCDLWFARWMLALYHRFLRTCMQNSHSGVFFLCFNTCFFLNVLDKFRWSIHWRSCRTPSDDPKWHFNSIRRIRSHEQQKLMRSNWKPLSTSQYIQYITLVLL